MAMPWEEFLDWLVTGIDALESLSHKKLKRRDKGWREDALRRIQRQTEHLIGKGLITPECRGNRVFLPVPYLDRARHMRSQKLLAAYLVARVLHGAPEKYLKEKLKLHEGSGALRQRVYESRKKLMAHGIQLADVVESEYAKFRSYDLGPYGKKITNNLSPLSYAHFDPQKALSKWERWQIAELCSAAL